MASFVCLAVPAETIQAFANMLKSLTAFVRYSWQVLFVECCCYIVWVWNGFAIEVNSLIWVGNQFTINCFDHIEEFFQTGTAIKGRGFFMPFLSLVWSSDFVDFFIELSQSWRLRVSGTWSIMLLGHLSGHILSQHPRIWCFDLGPSDFQRELEALPGDSECGPMHCYGLSPHGHAGHLHREIKVLPFHTHCDLLMKQYMLWCHVPGHPGNKHLNRPLPPQLMKNDLDTQLQLQFQSGKLANYAEKCSTVNSTEVVLGPYIPLVWHRWLRAMSTTKYWTPQQQKLTRQKPPFSGRLTFS